MDHVTMEAWSSYEGRATPHQVKREGHLFRGRVIGLGGKEGKGREPLVLGFALTTHYHQ